jgi:hypothetical protein
MVVFYYIVFCILVVLVVFIILYKRCIYNNTLEIFYHKTAVQSSNKNKVLVYQCGSYDVEPKFIELSKAINKAYCKKYGYSYVYIDYEKALAPPYWLKVIALKDLMDKHSSEYDYIMYLDNDAVFYDFNTRLETIIDSVNRYGSYSFIIGKEPNPFSLINTGVFLVKCNNKGKELVNKWSSMCLNETNQTSYKNWSYTNNKWSCSGKYAGKDYEQGAFETLYKDTKGRDIAILNVYFFSNSFKIVNSYILHLMAKKDVDRNRTFSNYKDLLNNTGAIID